MRCTVGAGLDKAAIILSNKFWQNLPLPNMGYYDIFFYLRIRENDRSLFLSKTDR
jgi:hypothetical protein